MSWQTNTGGEGLSQLLVQLSHSVMGENLFMPSDSLFLQAQSSFCKKAIGNFVRCQLPLKEAQMKSLFCLRSRICQSVLGFTGTYHSGFDAHSPADMMRKDSEKLQKVVLSEALGRGALGSTWPGDLHRSCITNMGLCSPRGCEVTVLESHSIIPFTSSALSQGYACLSEILFICFQVLAMTNDTALNIV